MGLGLESKKGRKYQDVTEDEYIFNALMNYPTWAKQKLTPAELKIFESEATIRRFVTHGNMENKRVLLAKGNIRFITFYVDFNQEDPFDLKKFVKLSKQFSVVKERQEIIKGMLEGNLFAVSSREVLSAAYLLAQNTHTPYFYRNMDYRRVYNAVETIGMKNLARFDGETDIQKTRDLENARTTVGNLVHALWESETFFRVHQKLEWMDVHILLFLYLHRDEFVETNAIYKHVTTYKKLSLQKRLATLTREGYCDFHKDRKITSYTIAELGIVVICELLESVCRKALIM